MDAVAGFLGSASQNRTVTVDSPVTAGSIVFDNAAHSYTLTGSSDNSITMSSLSGEAAITVTHGAHEISVPIVLASNLTVTVANAADALTLSGDISGTGAGLTLEGSGALFLSGDNSFDGGTAVNGGTLYVTNPEGLPDGTSLTVGANMTLILDRSAAGSPASTGQTFAASTISAVPEPGTLTLLVLNLCGAVAYYGFRRPAPARRYNPISLDNLKSML